MKIINFCTRSIKCILTSIYYLFNRLVVCCKGQPKAKRALAVDSNLKIATQKIKICDRKVSRPIYLIDDNHFISEKGPSELMAQLLQLAAIKKLIYAMEGLERDALAEQEFKDCLQKKIKGISNGYLYGLEDPFFNIFNTALDLNNLLREKSDALSINILNQKKIDLLCLLVSQTNQKYLQKFWDNKLLSNNAIFTSLNKLKARLLKQDLPSLNTVFRTVIEQWNNATWFNFTKEITLELGETLQTTLPKEKLPTLNSLLEDLKAFQLNSSYKQSTNELHAFMAQLHLTLRNYFLIANFKTIHALTEDTEQPLASILGEAHIEEIAETLTKEGYTVLGLKELKEWFLKNKPISI